MLRTIFNIKKESSIIWVALFLLHTGFTHAQERVENFSFLAYQTLELPSISNHLNAKTQRKIKIAVIDDGFNLDHELIKPFLSQNIRDIPNNYLDDDQNGFIDDRYGWNVADNNNDVSVTEGLEKQFYHGTMVASIISTVFLKSYDTLASEYLELIPIKAISNGERNTYVKDGYKGISYAIDRNVDIICCAWSGGDLTNSQKELLRKAESNGITIIGSAGNHYNKVLFPAADKSVVAVTAIDSNMVLIPSSNFGTEIDFVAHGDQVRAGHPLDNKAYFYGSGTSASVALVAGAFGVVKSQFTNLNKMQIIDALKYTSHTVDQFNLKYVGKIGAGIPQVKKALQYFTDPDSQALSFNSLLTEGTFTFKRKDTIQSYTVKPNGTFYGIDFLVDTKSKKKKDIVLEISTGDSTYLLKGNDPFFSNKHLAWGSTMTIKNATRKNRAPIRVEYNVINIDSSKLYCKDVKYLYTSENDLEDGSGTLNYSNNCDCRWIITAPPNKRIKLQFTSLNTQSNIDFIWIFAGSKSLSENLIAKFSGNNIPPIITSPTNEILLWFLSDGTTTNKGWNLNYSWVD